MRPHRPVLNTHEGPHTSHCVSSSARLAAPTGVQLESSRAKLKTGGVCCGSHPVATPPTPKFERATDYALRGAARDAGGAVVLYLHRLSSIEVAYTEQSGV